MIHDLLIAPFADNEFMRRALAGSLAIAVGSAPIGVFLMLRRMSLTGDAIAHGILPGAAVGYAIAGLSLTALTIGGLIAGMVVAVAAAAVSRSTFLREEASLAAFYLLSLALGVMIVSQRSSLDLQHFLFGSVLTLDNDALILLGVIAVIGLLGIAAIFRPLVVQSVDPAFHRQVSRRSALTHYTFLALAVLSLVAGFHSLGTLMAVGIMILPAVAARFWVTSVAAMVVVAMLIAVVSSVAGLLVSFHFDVVAAGPAIILVAGAAYLFSLVFGIEGSLLARRRPPRVPAL